MEIMHQITLGPTTIAVGHHDGKDMDVTHPPYLSEPALLENLSPRKKSEWLGSRELLFRISKLAQRVDCLYDEYGKPFLEGINKPVSVSHSEKWAAAMIGDRPCGVDIQVYSDTVRRISSRFLSDEEIAPRAPVRDHLQYLHILWGAKECVYKAYGKKKLEFRSHIRVHSLDFNKLTAIGEIRFEDIHLWYDIHFRILPEAAWVFCMQRTSDH